MAIKAKPCPVLATYDCSIDHGKWNIGKDGKITSTFFLVKVNQVQEQEFQVVIWLFVFSSDSWWL